MHYSFAIFCLLGALGSCTSPSRVKYFQPIDEYHPIEIFPQEEEAKKKKPSVHVEFAERERSEG